MIALAALHLAAALAAVTAVWLWQLRTRNASVIDAAWPLIIAAGGALYAGRAAGAAEARVIVAALAAGWGLRLGIYLALRNAGPHEERRYAELRARWGASANARMLGFFLFQGIVAWLVALTYLPVAFRDSAIAAPWLALGLALGLGGIAGEALADAQLQRFRRDPANRGRVMDHGLWRYSRHPNFFFECVHWLAYPCLAAGAGAAVLAWIGPAVIAFLLLKVSGIPTVEQRDASARRAGYAEYVRRTSAFVPWPPRRP